MFIHYSKMADEIFPRALTAKELTDIKSGLVDTVGAKYGLEDFSNRFVLYETVAPTESEDDLFVIYNATSGYFFERPIKGWSDASILLILAGELSKGSSIDLQLFTITEVVVEDALARV